jgi:hypothetical protein
MVMCVASASAALGRNWVQRTYDFLRASFAGHPAPAGPLPQQTTAASAPDGRSGLSAVQAPAVEVLDPTITEEAAPAAPPEPTRSPRVHGAPMSDETSLVFNAMRALRRDGQPDRAQKMLTDYMRRYPGGALAEEALALSIEAATMRGDFRAKDLASRYLARYPAGRFRQPAERALSRFSQ